MYYYYYINITIWYTNLQIIRNFSFYIYNYIFTCKANQLNVVAEYYVIEILYYKFVHFRYDHI